MKLSENHSRAQKMVDSWPAWKKEVSLTKYSTKSIVKASNKSDRGCKVNYSDREKLDAAG